MKKLAFVIVVLGLSFVSCEKSEIEDELNTEELQSVDPADDGTIDEEDHREG